MKMIEVTKEEFFAYVNGAPFDIHPRSERDKSVWETRSRVVIGESTPGYMCRGPTAFYLTEDSIASVRRG